MGESTPSTNLVTLSRRYCARSWSTCWLASAPSSAGLAASAAWCNPPLQLFSSAPSSSSRLLPGAHPPHGLSLPLHDRRLELPSSPVESPPHLNIRISYAELTHPDELDVEFDTFQTSKNSYVVQMSFKRMKTPVKGHLCKHHQCFDYENFMEMNSRKPIWRCPHCNQPVSMADLRIDQNMVKILGEVGEEVTEVVIHADGSWNVVSEQGRCAADRPYDEAQILDQANDMECEVNRSKIPVAEHVDLTMEEDGNCSFLTQDGCYDRIIEEAEDRKPFSDSMPQFLASHAPSQAPPAYQLGNSLKQPTFFPSYAANASPLPDQTHIGVGNASERMAGRAGFTRIIDRTPTAVQALPVPPPLQQIQAASRRLHSNMIDCALAPNLSPRQYQAVNMSTPSPLDTFGGGLISNNMDAQQQQQQQFTRITDASAMQDLTQQNQQYAVSEAAQAASPSTLSSRSPFSHRRGSIDMDAFRASLQPSPFARTPSVLTPPGFRTQSPNLLPSAAWQGPHSGFGNHQRLPPQFLRSLPASAAAPNSASPRENTRAIGGDRWRSLTGGGTSSLEQGWRPTGRMRGSLTGSDYSAVISNYMPPTAVNNLMAHGATAAGQDASGDARI